MTAALPASATDFSVPLVVDLDGTLIHGDLLHESALQLLKTAPLDVLRLPFWLAAGKATLKEQIARRVALDVAHLPYDDRLLALLLERRAAGQRLVLCTASNQRYAQAVADHLGLFDEVIASDATLNLSAARKAAALVQRFGARGFDYAGNAAADLPVWAQARQAVVVNAPPRVAQRARQQGRVALEIQAQPVPPTTWLRALRPHQWLKNLLVLLPVAGAFQITEPDMLQPVLLAFIAFGLCASSVYVLNDLMDLDSDRAHPRKRLRPFAAGLLSAPAGLAMAGGLLLVAAALAAGLRPAFQLALAGYYVLTLAYTFVLKRVALVDCMALGALYTLRIVAGWCAAGLPASFWLLAFSLFLFLSLAFLKRYSELLVVVGQGRAVAPGRGYVTADLPLIQTMGVASGFSSVMLLALYINGDTVLRLYSQPEVLWLLVPIHLYWVSYMWMKAQRGQMHDDPVIFAVRKRASLLCGLLFALTLVAAR